jgi:hypothetical protein
MGNNDGEEGADSKDGEAENVACVDEGRGAHAEDVRAREDKDDCDRAEAQAERGCGVSAGIKAGRDARGRSRGEEGVKGRSDCPVHGHSRDSRPRYRRGVFAHRS